MGMGASTGMMQQLQLNKRLRLSYFVTRVATQKVM